MVKIYSFVISESMSLFMFGKLNMSLSWNIIILGPPFPLGLFGACFAIHQLFSPLCCSMAAMNEIVLVFFSDENSVSRKLARRAATRHPPIRGNGFGSAIGDSS